MEPSAPPSEKETGLTPALGDAISNSSRISF